MLPTVFGYIQCSVTHNGSCMYVNSRHQISMSVLQTKGVLSVFLPLWGPDLVVTTVHITWVTCVSHAPL